ncbi:MAG: dUTP diphosphatase [Rickettsiales bacterium]|jgi:dUTP pyrophosphatase|nr:dUTP diphosphatase [Rickettsiales bacterium]
MKKARAKILYLPDYDRSWGDVAYAHPDDSGIDARACEGAVLRPLERAAIPLGFKLAPEPGYGCTLRPRSGNALNLGLGFANSVGTIDGGYRGELKAIAVNLSNETIVIERGMKIAQIVVEPVVQFELAEAQSESELEESSRGAGGFGSTGIK